jgi:hypothetical protein
MQRRHRLKLVTSLMRRISEQNSAMSGIAAQLEGRSPQ